MSDGLIQPVAENMRQASKLSVINLSCGRKYARNPHSCATSRQSLLAAANFPKQDLDALGRGGQFGRFFGVPFLYRVVRCFHIIIAVRLEGVDEYFHFLLPMIHLQEG